LIKAIRVLDIKSVYIDWSDSDKKWPDIWVKLCKIPVITVTAEWARQGADERRKRLVHELLHIKGYEHDEKIGYSTYPEKDTFSMKIYNSIKQGGR
jgi:hypothetical protein